MYQWIMKQVRKEAGDLGKGALRDAEALVSSKRT